MVLSLRAESREPDPTMVVWNKFMERFSKSMRKLTDQLVESLKQACQSSEPKHIRRVLICGYAKKEDCVCVATETMESEYDNVYDAAVVLEEEIGYQSQLKNQQVGDSKPTKSSDQQDEEPNHHPSLPNQPICDPLIHNKVDVVIDDGDAEGFKEKSGDPKGDQVGVQNYNQFQSEKDDQMKPFETNSLSLSEFSVDLNGLYVVGKMFDEIPERELHYKWQPNSKGVAKTQPPTNHRASKINIVQVSGIGTHGELFKINDRNRIYNNIKVASMDRVFKEIHIVPYVEDFSTMCGDMKSPVSTPYENGDFTIKLWPLDFPHPPPKCYFMIFHSKIAINSEIYVQTLKCDNDLSFGLYGTGLVMLLNKPYLQYIDVHTFWQVYNFAADLAQFHLFCFPHLEDKVGFKGMKLKANRNVVYLGALMLETAVIYLYQQGMGSSLFYISKSYNILKYFDAATKKQACDDKCQANPLKKLMNFELQKKCDEKWSYSTAVSRLDGMNYTNPTAGSGSRTTRRSFEFGRIYGVKPKRKHQSKIIPPFQQKVINVKHFGAAEANEEDTMSWDRFSHLFDLMRIENRAFWENRFEEAINYYSKAHNIKPHHPVILGSRCAAYLKIRQFLVQRSSSDSTTGLAPEGAYAGLYFINKPEWLIVDHTCSAYSYISAPLYDTLSPDVVKYIVNHTELQAIFCESNTLNTLLSFLSDIPSVRLIVVVGELDEHLPSLPKTSYIKLLPYSKLLTLGRSNLQPFRLPKPEDVATICYTTGKFVIIGGIDYHKSLVVEYMGTKTITETIDDYFSGWTVALVGETTMHDDFAIPVNGSLSVGFEVYLEKAKRSCMDYEFHMVITKWNDVVPEEKVRNKIERESDG